MITSYHTHTRWSDGGTTLAAMLQAARQAGVDEFGVSDHYVLAPGGEIISWSMPLDFLETYVAEVRAAQAATATPVLRLGLEADFFPETIEELRARVARYPFDYLIGSVHIVDGFPVDENAEVWAALSAAERNAVWRTYWQRLRALAQCGVFDIVGHLDVPKKYGFLPTEDQSAEIAATLDAIADAGMAIEINTAGWDKPIAEAYPAPSVLREACRRAIPLVITADAHAPEAITAHYARARALAREAGYTTLAAYAERRRSLLPL